MFTNNKLFTFLLLSLPLVFISCSKKEKLPAGIDDFTTNESKAIQILNKSTSAVRDDVLILQNALGSIGNYELVDSYIMSLDVKDVGTNEVGKINIYPYKRVGSQSDGAITYSLELPNRHNVRTVVLNIENNFTSIPDYFLYGVFGSENVKINGNVVIDSYEPTIGNCVLSWNSTGIVNSGIVRSNKNVEIDGSCYIAGDVISGPTYKVWIKGNPTITGADYAASEVLTLDNIEEIINNGTDLNLTSCEKVLNEGTYNYDKIVLSGNAKLVINGSVKIYCNSLNICGSSKVVLTRGELNIVCNTFKLNDNSSVNQEGIGKSSVNMSIYSIGNVVLNGNTIIYSRIFAPKSKISLSGNTQMFGSLIGSEILISGKAGVHYDKYQAYIPLNTLLKKAANIQTGLGFINGQLATFNASSSDILSAFTGLQIIY